jgi:signal transduction histidine kinase
MSEIEDPAGVADIAYGQLGERQLELIHEIDQRILDHSNTLADTLQFILATTRQVLNARHVDILFEYPDGLRVEISSDPAEIGRVIPVEESISGLVLSSHRSVMVNDLRSDPLLSERYFPRLETNPGGQAPDIGVLVAELTLDGQAIGVINVEAPDVQYEQRHLDFVEALARQVSMAITHAALFDEDNFRTATDRLLVEVTSGDSDVAMRQVLDRILTALNSLAFVQPDAADILFTDPQDGRILQVVYSTNDADIGLRVDINSSVCGEAFRRGGTVLLQRAFEREYYRPVVQGMICEMAIPIVLGGSDKLPIGVLNLESSRENAFSNVGKALAERFVRRVVNAIAMLKIRADIDNALQDQLMVLAADQVLNAVHRINNHVGSIRALARDLIEDLESPNPPEPGDMRRQLEIIAGSAERALEMPDDLRNRIVAPQESVDVNAQVRAGIAAVTFPRNIELVTNLAAWLPSIPCTALDLVVENLLLNAIRAMRDKAGPLSVRTQLDRNPSTEPFVVITVTDTGVGMTEAERNRLFEPRQAGHRGGGLGFGMMWVRGWVRRTQGLIEVESEPGTGTTVRIRFQLQPSQIEQVPQKGETERAPQGGEPS